jgi:hypothetical protein
MGRQIHFGRNPTIRVCSSYWAKVKATKAQPKIDETVQFVLASSGTFSFLPFHPKLNPHEP